MLWQGLRNTPNLKVYSAEIICSFEVYVIAAPASRSPRSKKASPDSTRSAAGSCSHGNGGSRGGSVATGGDDGFGGSDGISFLEVKIRMEIASMPLSSLAYVSQVVAALEQPVVRPRKPLGGRVFCCGVMNQPRMWPQAEKLQTQHKYRQ